MQKRHLIFLVTIIFFILFYPGDNFYSKIFSFNRELFLEKNNSINYKPKPIPFLKDKNYLPQLSAQGAYISTLDSFTPVFEKNSNQKFLPASTTKIITALTAIDYFKDDDILETKRSLDDGQVMGLVVGEKMTFENMLYGLLVYSGNDVAYTIADNYSQGFDKFVEKMNEKAKKLNMQNTHFKNPAGLDSFDQYSSPYDLALASRELLKNKLLSKIVSTKSITVSDVDFKYFHYLTNVNKLLGEIPGLGGLKTGYTEEAGENLISFYKKNNHDFIIVVLKSEDRFLDTKNIISWIESNVIYSK